MIKHFIAEQAIDEYTPVKQGTKEGYILPVTSPFDCVNGIVQSKVDAGKGVDVIILGESFVNCEGAVDGTAPLVANKNGKAEQLDLTADNFKDCEANTLVYPFARPIEISTVDAYLRCVVCPACFAVAGKTETVTTPGA